MKLALKPDSNGFISAHNNLQQTPNVIKTAEHNGWRLYKMKFLREMKQKKGYELWLK